MNCKDVEKIIRKQAYISPEIEEHIKSCSSCAQIAESSLLLKNILNSVDEKYTPTPFDSIKTRIENSSIKKETFMSKVKEQVEDRPKLIYGLGLAVIAFLFITLVPFSYTITDGYELSVNNADQLNISQKQLAQIIETAGTSDISFVIKGNQLCITNLPNKSTAVQIAATIEIISKTDIEYQVNPIYQTVSGSLYAQIKENIKVNIDGNGKTLDEIADEIKEQLSEFYTSVGAKVIEKEDGRLIQVKVNNDKDGVETEQLFELLISSDQGDDISFEISHSDPPQELDIDMEGKTDEEIVAEIKAKLAKQGEPDANVTINTTADGLKEINISVEKEETVGE